MEKTLILEVPFLYLNTLVFRLHFDINIFVLIDIILFCYFYFLKLHDNFKFIFGNITNKKVYFPF